MRIIHVAVFYDTVATAGNPSAPGPELREAVDQCLTH